ncbi:hypothetical protein F4805DRAFT_433839 [Annulohypoxylon moriforme]|nr:hypothetical protein F4805DRAFT_433839 [Annulohypoxylon moriforme]
MSPCSSSPIQGDKNTQVHNRILLPGKSIGRDVTRSQYWDWHIYSHVLIQGTAPTVH